MNQALRELLLTDPPKFHFWNGSPQVGGMGPSQLQLIEACATSLGSDVPKVFVETGAGISTIWALNLGLEVYSFVASDSVVDNVSECLGKYRDLTLRWHPVAGFSEETLPFVMIGENAPTAGISLIDGGHGIQTVFVDFVYLNYALKKDGILLVDDLQLGSPQLLARVLRQDKNFRPYGEAGKLGAFQKVTATRLLPDWGAQKQLLERVSAAFS